MVLPGCTPDSGGIIVGDLAYTERRYNNNVDRRIAGATQMLPEYAELPKTQGSSNQLLNTDV